MRTVGSLAIAAIAVAFVGCGGGSPSAPTVASAVIAVSANPSQIAGALCTGCGAGSTDREAATTVTVTETAGLGAAVTAIEMTLRETGTNAVLASGSFDAAAVTQLAGSNRVPARGTLNVRCGVHYANNLAGRTGVLTCVVRVTDDRGNQLSQTITVNTST
jgi:hypothetical protein